MVIIILTYITCQNNKSRKHIKANIVITLLHLCGIGRKILFKSLPMREQHCIMLMLLNAYHCKIAAPVLISDVVLISITFKLNLFCQSKPDPNIRYQTLWTNQFAQFDSFTFINKNSSMKKYLILIIIKLKSQYEWFICKRLLFKNLSVREQH